MKKKKISPRQYGVFYNYHTMNLSFRRSFLSALNAMQVFAQAYDKRTVYIRIDHVFHVYVH